MTISVLTPTRNRSDYLKLWLESLANQTQIPDEIIIIDNDSTDDTQDVIRKYRGRLPIKSKLSRAKGYPKIYNEAIKMATSDIIAFLDDDCIAESDWIGNILKAHKKYKNASIQGKTESIPRGNIYVEVMGDHYQNWIKGNIVKDNEMVTFDNKNMSIPAQILKDNLFSESMRLGSEDIELGKRLRRKGVKIYYVPSIKASHHERSTLKGFFYQHLRISRGEAVLDKKLSNDERVGMLVNKKNLLSLVSFLKREYSYLSKFDFINFFYLPFLYLLLLFTRIYGYLLKS